MSPLQHLCKCGNLIPKPGRCPQCEHTRNQQPHRQAHRTTAHQQLRNEVFTRDHHQCVDCRTTKDLTLDYIVPLQDGGTMSPNNAATRCRSCNSRYGRRFFHTTPGYVGSSRVDLQACKLEYSIVSPK